MYHEQLSLIESPPEELHKQNGTQKSDQSWLSEQGRASELLTIADLIFRGYPAGQLGGDVDVFANINGIIRKFQVKSSTKGYFGPGGSHNMISGNSYASKTINKYKSTVDAFAFVFPDTRMVLYIHCDAVGDHETYISIRPNKSPGLQTCNESFAELLRRWK